MPRPEKVATVAEIRTKLESARAAVLTEYRGLRVAELADLRAALRAADAEYKIFKNTLARRAAEEAGLADLAPLLDGPTAITFVRGDAVLVAKALRDYSRNNPALVVKGGILGTRVIRSDDVVALADIQPREVLLARVAGGLQAPLSKAAGLFSAFTRNMAYGLKALIDKRTAAGESAEVPEVAAPEPAPAAPPPTAPAPGEAEVIPAAVTPSGPPPGEAGVIPAAPTPAGPAPAEAEVPVAGSAPGEAAVIPAAPPPTGPAPMPAEVAPVEPTPTPAAAAPPEAPEAGTAPVADVGGVAPAAAVDGPAPVEEAVPTAEAPAVEAERLAAEAPAGEPEAPAGPPAGEPEAPAGGLSAAEPMAGASTAEAEPSAGDPGEPRQPSIPPGAEAPGGHDQPDA